MRTTRWLGAGLAALALGCTEAASAAELKEGDKAPAFRAVGDDGREYSLEKLRGKIVVLYFYPKDDTPGCTAEAIGFRDEAEQIARRGAVVLGVSTDDAASHQAFREKHGLNFPLLADGGAVAEAFGVPVRLGFASRQTFVVGRDGRILKIWRSVDPKGHAAEVVRLLGQQG